MVTPLPKTEAEKLFFEISSLEQTKTVLTEFQMMRYLRVVEKSIETGVDVGTSWITMGFIYSMSNNVEGMLYAFNNAKSLGMVDVIDNFNYATQYLINGFFEDAAYGFSKSYDDEAQDTLTRIAASTFNFELIESLLTSEKSKNKLNAHKQNVIELGIEIECAKEIFLILRECFQSRCVRFNFKENFISDEGEMIFYYDVFSSEIVITEILREFDARTSTYELFEVASKINIIPIQDIRFYNSSKII